MTFFNVKKRFFKRELKQTQAKIWSLEFARYTSLFEREATRQKYDSVNDAYQRAQANKDTDKETLDNLKKQVDALKHSLDELTVMIEGSEPNGAYPDGVQGIVQSLEAQIQKRDHIKNFIKQYC
jgi:predicted nuclease with TOPRIM domain